MQSRTASGVTIAAQERPAARAPTQRSPSAAGHHRVRSPQTRRAEGTLGTVVRMNRHPYHREFAMTQRLAPRKSAGHCYHRPLPGIGQHHVADPRIAQADIGFDFRADLVRVVAVVSPRRCPGGKCRHRPAAVRGRGTSPCAAPARRHATERPSRWPRPSPTARPTHGPASVGGAASAVAGIRDWRWPQRPRSADPVSGTPLPLVVTTWQGDIRGQHF